MISQKLAIKPISINEAYKGRRYSTPKLKKYKEQIGLMLKAGRLNQSARIGLKIYFGYSSSGSDIDNGVKPFLDCLQDKYSFNDNRIYELKVYKSVVPKGAEYITFELYELVDQN